MLEQFSSDRGRINIRWDFPLGPFHGRHVDWPVVLLKLRSVAAPKMPPRPPGYTHRARCCSLVGRDLARWRCTAGPRFALLTLQPDAALIGIGALGIIV
jgi:hypothetical protein